MNHYAIVSKAGKTRKQSMYLVRHLLQRKGWSQERVDLFMKNQLKDTQLVTLDASQTKLEGWKEETSVNSCNIKLHKSKRINKNFQRWPPIYRQKEKHLLSMKSHLVEGKCAETKVPCTKLCQHDYSLPKISQVATQDPSFPKILLREDDSCHLI